MIGSVGTEGSGVPDGGPSRVDHLVLAGAVKQDGLGQLPNPALDRVELGEVPRPAAGHFPDQLVHRQSRGMKLQNLAKDRRLLAVVFLMGRDKDRVTFPALRVVVHGSYASCAMPRLFTQRGGTFAVCRRRP
jgi:hypothetical protein